MVGAGISSRMPRNSRHIWQLHNSVYQQKLGQRATHFSGCDLDRYLATVLSGDIWRKCANQQGGGSNPLIEETLPLTNACTHTIRCLQHAFAKPTDTSRADFSSCHPLVFCHKQGVVIRGNSHSTSSQGHDSKQWHQLHAVAKGCWFSHSHQPTIYKNTRMNSHLKSYMRAYASVQPATHACPHLHPLTKSGMCAC